MDGRLVTAQCRTADFSAVETALREWPEVEAVGSFREKSNNKKDITTVFVTFADGDTAKAATEKLSSIKDLIVEEKSGEPKKTQNSNASQRRNKNMAAQFIKYESRGESKRSEVAPQHRARGRGTGRSRGTAGGRGSGQPRSANDGNSNEENNRERSARGRRGGRGGQNQGRGRGNYQQHTQQAQTIGPNQVYQHLPPLEASAAFADNVPFGTTNDHLMEIFSPYGRILDINRLELMTMVCYDNPESVQQCIQHVNGTKIGSNIITVSSGIVRIPGSVAAYLGM